MSRTTCDPCCAPQEFARSVESYRASVLQLLCNLFSSGALALPYKTDEVTVTDLDVTAASTQIWAGGDHNGAFLYNPNAFSVWVNYADPAVANGTIEIGALQMWPVTIGPSLYTGPIWGIHTQVGTQNIQLIRAV